MQFLKETFTNMLMGFLVAVQIDPSTDIKLKNVVLVMQLALFLQISIPQECVKN